MGETIFQKIIDGKVPCHKVYEDDRVIAFLDIGPLSRGHTLVVPKEKAETLDELSEESSAAVGRVLPRLARAVLKATGAKAFNVLQNNGAEAHQAVMHVHFHIIPRFGEGAAGGAGLKLFWHANEFDHAAGKKLAAEIAGHLSG